MKKKNRVWIVHVTTESCDHYYYAFKEKPDREAIAKKVWEYEGSEDGELEGYENSISCDIKECEVE